MADDPLYGDRPKPPLVPMNNAEVIDFDVIRGLDGAPPGRRWPVVSAVALLLVVISLLAFVVAGSRTATHVTHLTGVRTPHQLLLTLCSQLHSAETAFTGGSINQHAFEQRLTTIATATYTPELGSAAVSKLLGDVQDQQAELAQDGYFGGPSLDDAHHLCIA